MLVKHFALGLNENFRMKTVRLGLFTQKMVIAVCAQEAYGSITLPVILSTPQ